MNSFVKLPQSRTYSTVFTLKNSKNADGADVPIPRDRVLVAEDIEVLRVLGKIDLQADKSILEESRRELEKLNVDPDTLSAFPSKPGRVTSVRVFEARLSDGTKCFFKEYLPVGLLFGRRELSTTRKLTKEWNEMIGRLRSRSDVMDNGDDISMEKSNDPDVDMDYDKEYTEDRPGFSSKSWLKSPFPTLLGTLKTDKTIEDEGFRIRWSKRFPYTKPPEAGNLWLLFRFDESSFKTLKNYPPLPQFVEGFDYFRKDQRVLKRWKFIRKIFKRSLESLAFLHSCGICHNAVSTESTWLTTTNQQEIEDLYVRMTDLGVCQRFADLGPFAREAALNDMYQLGFLFLELVLASFSEDNVGASMARAKITGEEYKINIFSKAEDLNLSQITQKELIVIFENQCDSDFGTLRSFVGNIKAWKEAYEMLEKDEGAAWKLIFTLLAKGRLRENDDPSKTIKVTPSKLLNDFKGNLFRDI